MKEYQGIAENIENPIIGLITRNPLSLSRRNCILVTEDTSFLIRGFAALITKDRGGKTSVLPRVKVTGDVLNQLEEGDCVTIDSEGIIQVLWETSAPENPLLLTEMCNCRCIMCPQPPNGDNVKLTEICKKILDLVHIKNGQMVCITGGEPTLLKEGFFDILEFLKRKYPECAAMMLTNGQSFSSFEFTKRFVSSRPADFLTCVSMHSDIDAIHDRIAGVGNSFYKTVSGLHNLARFRERIEIRVVVNRINAGHLESIATFIQRNFPFITHCAFMGMEITGLARDNYNSVWIDPYDYRDELSRAIRVLSRANIDASIYNIPLCLVEQKSWSFARRSISAWKNDFLPACGKCSVKLKCCGIFTSSGIYQSSHINPI